LLVAPLLDRAIATGGQNHAYPFSDFGCRRGPGGRAGAIRFGRGSLDAADLQRAYFTWTGWYVGLNGGGGWGQTNHTATVNAAGLPPVTTNNFNTSGWLGGGTIGYNYQMGQWLVGAEADLDWSNIRGTFNGTVPVAGVGAAAFSLSSQLNWLDTTRVRVGWVWDHTLFYGTAGAAVGGVTATAAASAAAGGIGAAVTAADTQTRFGWTAGAGVEYAFNNYLSAKVEYMYVNLGTQTQINVDSVKFNTNIVRAGINLHF
jgi:outer membrane immunogenic protein